MDDPIKCPCCGLTDVREHDICEVCDWQNDPNQRMKPTLAGGANQMSLDEARAAYAEGLPVK
ncbi:MAG: CPCC family cysteine-rich protein [Clostridia bacterium]